MSQTETTNTSSPVVISDILIQTEAGEEYGNFVPKSISSNIELIYTDKDPVSLQTVLDSKADDADVDALKEELASIQETLKSKANGADVAAELSRLQAYVNAIMDYIDFHPNIDN